MTGDRMVREIATDELGWLRDEVASIPHHGNCPGAIASALTKYCRCPIQDVLELIDDRIAFHNGPRDG